MGAPDVCAEMNRHSVARSVGSAADKIPEGSWPGLDTSLER